MSFGVVAAVVTTVGTIGSISAGRKSGKSQEAANAAQMKINRLRNAQQKRLFLNEVRKFLAETTVSGVAALGGGYESSRIEGTLQSERTQRDLAVREFKQLDELGGEFTAAMNRAARQSFQSQTYGQLGNLAGNLGGYDKISDWLKPKKPSSEG